ncbi:MAG: TM2 domain-containing protein [Ruminococcus sp.]|nr:TM2 domain-containing protein [Ruminococcus sp.]MDE6784574.1 TM2 domain-containing protein [Ruminococcus sp.]
MQQNVAQQNVYSQNNTKFCKHCGGKIPHDAVICTLCGRQVEELKQSAAPQPQVIVNNTNTNMNTNINAGGANLKNKWVAFWLCFFFGGLGIHKFYEGKILMGIIYFFTVGFFGIGSLIDLIRILLKPKYYQP